MMEPRIFLELVLPRVHGIACQVEVPWPSRDGGKMSMTVANDWYLNPREGVIAHALCAPYAKLYCRPMLSRLLSMFSSVESRNARILRSYRSSPHHPRSRSIYPYPHFRSHDRPCSRRRGSP